MKEKSKSTNHSKKALKENKNWNPEIVYLGEYYSVHTRKKHPLTVRFVETETARLVEWAQQDTSLMIQDFWLHGGYGRQTFYDWIQQFPEFQQAYQYAMEMIGSRRELGAMTRKFDAGTIHRTLGAYNHIWRNETIALAKLKEDSAAQEKQIVVIEAFAKTPEEVAMAIHKATGDAREYGPTGERKKIE